MRVYVIPPQGIHGPYETAGTGTLHELQAIVGGYIEPCAPVQLKEQGIELLANEEGLLRQLPYNINMFPFFFVGTLVAVGVDGEYFVSLTPKQENYLREWLDNLS